MAELRRRLVRSGLERLERQREERRVRQQATQAADVRRRREALPLVVRERVRHPEAVRRLREAAIQQEFFRERAVAAARGDVVARIGEMLAVGIGEQPFLAAAARHDAFLRADDVDGARVHEAVLVERGDRHLIEARRDELHRERVEAVGEDGFEILSAHRLVAADLDELVEKADHVVPDLAVLGRRREVLILLLTIFAGLRPLHERRRHVEALEQVVNRLRIRAHGLSLLQLLGKRRKRLRGTAADVVDGREHRRVFFRRLLFLVDGAMLEPRPRVGHRPAPRAAHAELQHIVLELVDLVARDGEKARAQRADDGLVTPAAHSLERRAHELSERMMHGLPLAVDEHRDGMVVEHEAQELLIRCLVAHEHADVAPAQSRLAHEAQDVRRDSLDLDAAVRRLDDLHARAAVFLRHDGRTEQPALDRGERRRMETAGGRLFRRLDGFDIHGCHAGALRNLRELVHRAVRAVEQPRRMIFRVRETRRERQRHRHVAACCEQPCEHLLFLRVEEDEAVDPDFRALDER